MWQVWSRSGDDAVDRLFALGVAQMRRRQLDEAVDTFSQVIQRQPGFAEGWNKRATVYFILGDYRQVAEPTATRSSAATRTTGARCRATG